MAISGRVTDNSIHTRVLANLQRNIAKGEKIQEQLSSGKQINRPSDSPAGTVSSMQLRGETRANQQYSRNADDGLGWLGTVDASLSSSTSLINRARELAVKGLNTGALDAEGSAALAAEMDQIKDSLIGYANTKYMDRPVFGGTTAGATAYDEGGAYIGDDGEMTRTVGANPKVRVGATGPEAFGSGDTQLFTVLTNLSDAVRSGDSAAMRDNLPKLDSASNTL